MAQSHSFSIFWLLLLFASLCVHSLAQEILQTVQGTIGAENYTYYRMSRPGRLLIELESLEGDADLLVTSDNVKPTFDKYEIQSISCGKDVIEIPNTFTRPFWVGIYGHFAAELSTYKVTVYLLDKLEEMDYAQLTHHYYDYEAADHMFYNYDASDYMFRDVKPSIKSKSTAEFGSSSHEDLLDEDESAGSVIWQILLTLLKVVFEVIL